MKQLIKLLVLTGIAMTVLLVQKIDAATDNTFLIVNKATNKMAFYQNGTKVKEFRVATGRYRSYTPEGTFTITKKMVNPVYYAANIRGGDPRNPLGNRWMGINARGTNGTVYGIHGNNDESSIGKYASAGCVRMHENEILWLYSRIPLKTKVVIIHSKQSFDQIAYSKKLITNKPITTIPVEIPKEETQTSSRKYHVVKKGETLWRVATVNKKSVKQVMEYNQLKDHTIHVGQKLWLEPVK